MTTQVLLTLPDETYNAALRLAQLTGREVSAVLTDTLGHSLPPLSGKFEIPPPVETLSSEDLLMATTLQLEDGQDQRLSGLLDAQQSRKLTRDERAELELLMQVYQEGLLRKAQALREAVHRGLIPPLG